VIEVLDVMMEPAGIVLRLTLIIGSFWLVPMAWHLVRDEAHAARREAQLEHSRFLHPAGADLVDRPDHLPYDYEADGFDERDEDLLAVYDDVVFDGFPPDADQTFEEVATRLDLPVERVRTLLGSPWLD
jgi:hypothetical protein